MITPTTGRGATSPALRLLPFLAWRHRVTRAHTRADMVAGLTGALLVLPQGVAFATIAGLPPEYGLYSAMVPAIIAALWGSSWHLVTGPTTAISIVVFEAVSPLAEPGTDKFIEVVLTLTLLTGLFQLVLGLARMGALVNFISHTVVVGFTAGAAVLIAAAQIKNFLGLDMPRGLSLWETLRQAVEKADQIDWYVVAVGAATLLTGILLRKRLKQLHMIIALVVGSIAAILLDPLDGPGQDIATVGALQSGLPPLSLPDFSSGTIGELIVPAMVVTLLALTEAVSISRSLALKSGQSIDGNQEFMGQGLANIFGSFFSSYAASGSFNRSGVNFAAGAKTPLASVFSSFFLLAILLAVSPLAAYLPTAAMAGILFLVAYGLIDGHHIRSILSTSRREGVILVVTFVGTLISLDKGILVGIALSLLFYLYRTSRPQVISVLPDSDPSGYYYVPVDGAPECPQYKMVRVQGSLFFGAVNHVQRVLRRIDEINPGHKHVMLAATTVNFVDIAGAEMLAQEAARRRELGGGLYIYRPQPSVVELLEKGEYLHEIGEENLFPTKTHPIDTVYPRLDSDICRTCTAQVFPQCRVALPNGEARDPAVQRSTVRVASDDADASWAADEAAPYDGD
ncbi:SulP family inorganic anion transporter [Nocardioides sp.]|uniref:SulP family inorganic anion transporter n=1 Tax=Nocardioides sp. TaxID=35761 RepID=UPI003528AAAE